MTLAVRVIRYIYIQKTAAATLNLDEVMAFDCGGNFISPKVCVSRSPVHF
jgi:hypothetical protein